MRITFMGSGEFGVPSLDAIRRSGHEIVEIITQPSRPAGRGKAIQKTPVHAWADANDIPCLETDNVNRPDIVEHVIRLQPQILLVIAFGQKIGRDLLHIPNCPVINLHASLLPKYRGAAPINWAIIQGEKTTGLTIFELNDAWDAGHILGQSETEIRPGETAGELHDRLSMRGPNLVLSVLDQISRGCAQSLPQDQSQACRAPKLNKTDAAIDWNQPAGRLCNFIHGFWPWPGAYCFLRRNKEEKTERITLAKVKIVSPCRPVSCQSAPPPPGTLDDQMNIACANGSGLTILELKPDNSRMMTFQEFINGRRLHPGEQLLNG